MPLAAGTRIGPYEIHAALGAGGMGEVYKARDPRLDRIVALKILPTEFAADPERRARFEREARIIAGLSDPHICVVHDVGRDGEVNYLVMEYLEGETLAENLARRSEPLPVDQVVRYAGDIAHALAKAHKAGIVHRDLKPGNIMLTKTGAKLLDFGLAKPKAPVGGLAISFAETRAVPATVTGTVLGTVPYMAPEQVEGREADARSDIWSLGVVIYEMATGTRPFQGTSPASVIGAILKDTPRSMRSLQTLTPPALEHLVERCLDKDPEERWQHAGDIKRALAWVARAPGGSPTQQALGQPVTRSRFRPLVAGVGLTAALGTGLLIGTTARRTTSSEQAAKQDVLRFQVLPPSDTAWSPSPNASTAQLAISPDGSRLAFVAAKYGDSSRIWIRPLDRLDARPVPGTEGAAFPFWSPDGRFLAFFAAGKLKKVDVELGTPQVLCDVVAARGGAWSPMGVIVFGNTTSPLSRVSADGGPVTPATSFDPVQDPAWHYWPHFLPDGRHFLYLQRSVKPEYQGIFVGSLDSPETTRLVGGDVRGLFASGRLLFVRDGLLFAQPLDLETLRLTGEPVRLAEGIGYYASAFGYAAVDVSTQGVIAFGPTLRTRRSLQSFDRDGRSIGPSVDGSYTTPRLSPDQRLVAVAARDDQGANTSDIWVIDLARGLPSRVTSDPQSDWFPAWMPDGKRLLFASTRSPSSGGANSIYRRDVSGAGADETLSAARLPGFPDDLSPDGKLLLTRPTTKRGYDIRVASLEPDGSTVDYLSSPFNEIQARFSPDQQWVAYASDESGRFDVYVRAYPSAADRIPISVNGGTQPEWRRDGKELFYLSADRKIVAVPITRNGNGLVPGTPQALFSIDVTEPVAPYPSDYTVSADGQRFVVSSLAKATTPQTLTVLYNWTSYLGKQAAAGAAATAP